MATDSIFSLRLFTGPPSFLGELAIVPDWKRGTKGLKESGEKKGKKAKQKGTT